MGNKDNNKARFDWPPEGNFEYYANIKEDIEQGNVVYLNLEESKVKQKSGKAPKKVDKEGREN